MKVVNLSEKPSLLNQYLKEMRSVDVQKDSMRFRRNIERIGEIMAVEISKQLTYAVEQVQTPLAVADMEIPQDQVVLGTLLRAGLPMHQGFLNMFDKAENAFISAYRKETIGRRGEMQIEIVSEYLAAPSIEGKTLILVDPMLATGGSAVDAINMIKEHGGKDITFVCIVAAPEGLEKLSKSHPDVKIIVGNLDRGLNEAAYICPGLGDAGDRIFGTK